MFDLETQALAIIAQLKTITGLETVAYIDQDRQAVRQPATLPAAFLALDSIKSPAGKTRGLAPSIAWTVVVRSKKLDGTGGCLPLIDSIIDVLAGSKPGSDMKPLSLTEVQYFDQRLESVAYTIRFEGHARGVNLNPLAGRN